MEKNRRGESKRQTAIAIWEPRRQEIAWLYHEQKWSQKRLADYYNVSQTAISKVLRRLEIASLGRGRKGNLNGRYKDGSESTLYRLVIQKDHCSLCQATERLVIHHRNFDHQDNHLENLQVLCDACHNRLHTKRWWQIQKCLSNNPIMAQTVMPLEAGL